MQPSQSKNNLFSSFIHSGLVLFYNELKRNLILFLIPLPVFAILLNVNIFSPGSKIIVGANGTWAYISIGILLAMTYGLQCFSQDADKKTLDFIITRPISLYLIILVKYLTSIGIFLIWSFLIRNQIQLNLSELPLPNGMGEEWILLTFLTIHAISLFSGLLVKGLERFFAIIILTGSMTYLCYQFWVKLFDLLMANYFWYDIPPYQMNFVIKVFPILLAILALITPLIATLWQLKNRIPLQHFTSGKTIIGIWLSIYLLILMAQYLFSPPLWPDGTFKSGDWHDQAGIVTASTVDPSYEDRIVLYNEQVKFKLNLTQLGQKPKVLYQGYNLYHPSISPNGKMIAFTEDNILKVMNIKTKEVIEIYNPKSKNNLIDSITTKQPQRSILYKPNFAIWGEDSKHLIYVDFLNDNGLSNLYLFHTQKGLLKKINKEPLTVGDLVWDSCENALYIIGNDHDNAITYLNTNSLKQKTYPMPSKIRPSTIFSLTGPCVIDHRTEKILLVMKYLDTIRIYSFDIHNKEFDLVEQYVDERIKPNIPILLNNNLTAFIFPRLDGSFQYKATKFHIDKNHDHDHDHEHDDHDHDHDHDHEH